MKKKKKRKLDLLNKAKEGQFSLNQKVQYFKINEERRSIK